MGREGAFEDWLAGGLKETSAWPRVLLGTFSFGPDM